MTTTDRARGGMYGHLVGDALGVPYEFRRHVETVEWRGHGAHDQPAGTWSDDGALMLATLDSLLDVGFEPADQVRRFLAWRDRGAYTPHREGRFDIGGATARALDRLGRGVPAEEAGDDSEAPGQRLAHAHPAHRSRRSVARVRRARHAGASVEPGHPRCAGLPRRLRALRGDRP